jgi:6-phosphogluconolactonase
MDDSKRARPQPWSVIVGKDLAETAKEWIVARAQRPGEFRIALAGGSTPRRVYERLASQPLDWSNWHVWWSDERLVPSDHPDSNERMARDALLDAVPIPPDQIHPLRSEDTPLPARFDLVLLGMGSDGHTASLFPESQALDAADPIVRVERPDHPRLTFTYATINGATAAAFLVSGGEKADIVRRVIDGDQALPAARVEAQTTVILCDTAAHPDGTGQVQF